MIDTIRWKEGCVELIDQTLLPSELVYKECRDVKVLAEAIESLRVRGAPAIGVAGAFGVALGLRRSGKRGGKPSSRSSRRGFNDLRRHAPRR